MIGVDGMDNRWFLWILIINACLAAAYFVYRGIVRKDYRRALLLSVFILLVPVAGAAFLAGSEAVNFVLFHKRDGTLNEEELSFSKKRTRMIISDDIEKESDRVPVEEALLVSDTLNRRQSFLEILKRPDVEEYIPRIQGAMLQEDSEVVHYAASYITDTVARYKETEKKLREIYERSKDIDALVIYLRFCDSILHKKIMSGVEQNMYMNLFESYMEELYQKDKEKINGDMLADIIDFWSENNNPLYEEKWVLRAGEIMETELPAAKAVLKYYFTSKNEAKFKEAVRKIKESPLSLDGETLEWVRFYGQTGW